MGKRNITSNAITPGFIETDMTAELPAKELADAVPAARIGRPEEVAAAVAFLVLRRGVVRQRGDPRRRRRRWAPETSPHLTTNTRENRHMASQQEILEAIRAELAAIKVPDAETAQPDTTWEQLDVDSLDLVELVKALEDRFDVQIADPDLKGIASVGDAITLVERLQGATA